MSWRDKVQAMREGEIFQKCLDPSLTKTTETLFVVFGSTPPTHFQEKTGFSGHEAASAGAGSLESGHAVNDPTAPPVPDKPVPDQPAKRRKQTFMDWQDNWRELDQAYQRHHFNCPTCIAAGRGVNYGLRCGAGAMLYRAYEDAS